LALGFLAAVGLAACSSAEDASSEGAPPYTGPLAPSPGAAPPSSTPPADNTAANGSPDPVGSANPTPPPGASNEGDPDVTQLVPPTPTPSEGAGGTGSEPQGAAGTGAPPTEPTPPVDPDPPATAARTQAFLLFGQSNMWGVPNPEAQDLQVNPKVEVLTLSACGQRGANQWVPAQPPLHGCVGQPGNGSNGPGVGPGDYFARTVAAAFPDDTILLVPNAIPGVSIDVFQPGQQAYNSIITRARMAQERGEIRGIIFHQGETDCGSTQTWPSRVKTVVDRLRSDLGIPDAPFVAGELLYVNPCSSGMNPVINSLPNTIPNSVVVSANGNFGAVQGDGYNNLHFNLAAQREFGRRYGEAMLGLLQP
jgi:carbohydrate esterase-like sialic acid-specific acetylesterase